MTARLRKFVAAAASHARSTRRAPSRPSSGMTGRRGLALVAVFALVALTQSAGELSNAHAAKRQLDRVAWRLAIRNLDLPDRGCFSAAYPQVAWKRVGCVTVPVRPAGP